MEEKYIGAAIDTRPLEERQRDYKYSEIAAAGAPVTWRKKSKKEWRKYPTRNQDGSGSCVAQGTAKVAGIENEIETGEFVELSATPTYQSRSGKPEAGMIAFEAWNYLRKSGAPLELDVPSQCMSDAAMDKPVVLSDKAKADAYRYRIGNYFDVARNIDAIGEVIIGQQEAKPDTTKGVALFVYATMAEWNRDVPTILNPTLSIGEATVRHCVAGIDAFIGDGAIVPDGVRSILIDDSWGKFYGLDGQRVLTEDFIRARCFYAGTVKQLKNAELGEIPRPIVSKFVTPMRRGMYGPQIKALQQVLQYGGYFPKNVPCNGKYGPVTASAVLAFQLAQHVATDAELLEIGGNSVGPLTRVKLNALYVG